ncbi:MAG: MFS transporter [Anaerolineaceae bacterium]|nr:MAG: MFS transporter [Anaerolineaceae bacterium]
MSRLRLFTLVLVRVVLNTAHRMIYPFLAVFARGLGVDIGTVSALVANRSLIGAATPFLFPFVEPRGRRFGMLLGAGLVAAAMGLVALWPTLATFGTAMVLALVGKTFFDPSMLAYVADHTPYEQRGTATAFAEFAWSLSFIFGVPAVGFLIAQFGWSAPFGVLSLTIALACLLIAWTVRDSHRPAHHADGIFGNVRAIFTSAPVLAGLSIGLFASMANEVVNLLFGVWLEDSFQLQIAALAGASAVIGLSELGGEGLVALLADRLGKVRASGLGLAANCLAAILLPVMGRTEFGALAGLFLFYITFEFTLVTSIPLMSEIMPSARATTLSFNLAAHSLGRMGGALLAPVLYALGFSFVTTAAVIINLLGIAAVWYVSRHHQ